MRKIFVRLIFLIALIGMGVLSPDYGQAEQMEPSEFSQGVEYTLLMSREDKVCKHMLTLFNQDLAQFGTEKYDAHEEFRSIGWKKETITRMEGDREVTDFVEAAHFDINNDGKIDLVFRLTGPMGGYDRDTLYIFPSMRPSEKRWTLMEIAHSPGRISYEGYFLLSQSDAGKKKKGALFHLWQVSLGWSLLCLKEQSTLACDHYMNSPAEQIQLQSFQKSW